GQLHGFAHGDGAGVRLVHARNHLEQRGFTSTVTTDDADNGTGGYAEGHVFVEQTVTEGLADALHLDHLAAQAWSGWNVEFGGFIPLQAFLRAHLLKAGQAGLALGLASLDVGTHPLKLLLDGFLVRSFLLGLHLETLFFVFQPLAVVAFEWDAVATVQFENPAGDV